jgi:hypothetical protein
LGASCYTIKGAWSVIELPLAVSSINGVGEHNDTNLAATITVD